MSIIFTCDDHTLRKSALRHYVRIYLLLAVPHTSINLYSVNDSKGRKCLIKCDISVMRMTVWHATSSAQQQRKRMCLIRNSKVDNYFPVFC